MKRKTKDHKTPTLVLFIEKKEHRVKERFSCTCQCPRKWKGPGKDHFNCATRWRSCHGAQRPFWERKHLQQHRNNQSWGRFLCLSRSVFGRHFEMGTGTEIAFQVNLTLWRRDKNIWITIEFRRWTRTKPSTTTVSKGIFDTSLWKINISNDLTAQGDTHMLLVLWKYFGNDKDNLVSEDNYLFIFHFSRLIFWSSRGFGN